MPSVPARRMDAAPPAMLKDWNLNEQRSSTGRGALRHP
jgi:hypothetical protein